MNTKTKNEYLETVMAMSQSSNIMPVESSEKIMAWFLYDFSFLCLFVLIVLYKSTGSQP
jgi:hypothetical protein